MLVYEPTDAYQNAPKRAGLEKLTPARALIAELVRRYSVLGLECTNLEVQKLAWFLVDWLRIERAADLTVDSMKEALRKWPGGRGAAARKLKLFDDRLLGFAIERLAVN